MLFGCHLIVTSLFSVSNNAEGVIDRRSIALDMFPDKGLIALLSINTNRIGSAVARKACGELIDIATECV
jgi:hypothetical protein